MKPVCLYEFSSGASREILVGFTPESARTSLASLSANLEYAVINHEVEFCSPFSALHVHAAEHGELIGACLSPYQGKLHIGQTLDWLTEGQRTD
ncbi:MAG: hypothetical protein JW889_04790 [Verrucomicrobia bacterium]|nr:hypothetical protein [Verrucomicrobiota bacterium]